MALFERTILAFHFEQRSKGAQEQHMVKPREVYGHMVIPAFDISAENSPRGHQNLKKMTRRLTHDKTLILDA